MTSEKFMARGRILMFVLELAAALVVGMVFGCVITMGLYLIRLGAQ